MLASHEEATEAVRNAIILKHYDEIDTIIDDHVGSLTTVKHSRTPVFSAVEDVLVQNQHIGEQHTTAVTGLIVEGLSHIFEKVEQKLASADKSDKELLLTFTDKACNHISHTSLLSSGGTVRDILEGFCGVKFDKKPYDKGFIDVYKFVNRYGLMQKKEVVEEKLTAKAARYKGMEL